MTFNAMSVAKCLHELRNATDCHYDCCVGCLLRIGSVEINENHDFLRSAVNAAEEEFCGALMRDGFYHLVEQALIRIAEEYTRCQIVPFPSFADHRRPPAALERQHE